MHLESSNYNYFNDWLQESIMKSTHILLDGPVSLYTSIVDNTFRQRQLGFALNA